MNRSGMAMEHEEAVYILREHEEAPYTMRIFDAVHDLLWHDILRFFALPVRIRYINNANWAHLHGKFALWNCLCTYFREIIR